jgi:hypothetical protein
MKQLITIILYIGLWCVSIPIFAQFDLEYSASQVRENHIHSIKIWEQGDWDELTFGEHIDKDSCLYIEKEYNKQGILISSILNKCPEKQHYKGDYFAYDAQNRLTAHSKGELEQGETWFRGIFYSPNLEIDSVMYDRGLKKTIISQFNEVHKIKRREIYQQDDLIEWTDFKYNDKGQLIHETGRNEDRRYSYEYSYNDKDSLAEKLIFYNNTFKGKEIYHYDNQGFLHQISAYTFQVPSDTVLIIKTFEYYNKHKLKSIKVSEEKTSNSASKRILHHIEYDMKGNVLHDLNHIQKDVQIIKEYSYDNQYHIKSFKQKENNKIIIHTKYEYDSRNRLINIKQTENGNLKQVDYEYDDYGLIVKKTLSENGKFLRRYFYKYQFFEK